jgi:uncharacterized membrane protein
MSLSPVTLINTIITIMAIAMLIVWRNWWWYPIIVIDIACIIIYEIMRRKPKMPNTKKRQKNDNGLSS